MTLFKINLKIPSSIQKTKRQKKLVNVGISFLIGFKVIHYFCGHRGNNLTNILFKKCVKNNTEAR